MDEGGGVLEVDCEVCGMREYYLEDGYYYCSICNTQSQKSRHFVEEEQEFVVGMLRSRVATLKTTQPPEHSATQSGIKLTNWEVYNLILKASVDKLIKEGYPALLKNQVLLLYSEYLIRRKAVFVSLDRDARFAVGVREPKGNIYSLYDLTPQGKKTWGVKNDMLKQKRESRLVEASFANKKLATRAKTKAFSEEYSRRAQSYDNRTPEAVVNALNTTESSSMPKKSSNVYLRYTKSLQRLSAKHPKVRRQSLLRGLRKFANNKEQAFREPENFNIRYVLIILFVALRQIGCKILYTDILRMWTEGILKVDNLAALIHERELRRINMACQEYFRQVSGNLSLTGESISCFLEYMEIVDFPYPTIPEFIPKFMDDLKLPRDFEILLCEINKTIPATDIFRSCRYKYEYNFFPELIILAMVVLILKMLFGLDDVTEKFQSLFARKVNEIMKKIGRRTKKTKSFKKEYKWAQLFVLEDWFTSHRLADDIIENEKRFCGSNTSRLCNIEAIHRYIHSLSIPCRNLPNIVQSCGAIKEIFQESIQEQFDAQQTLFPCGSYSCALPREDIVQKYLKDYPFVAHHIEYDLQRLQQTFSKCRIDYIINPEKYVPILQKCGYKVKVLPGDARAYSEEDLSLEENTLYLFQPFKSYDDTLGDVSSMPESCKYLFSLFGPTFAGSDFSAVQPVLKSLVTRAGDCLCRLSVTNMFPLAVN